MAAAPDGPPEGHTATRTAAATSQDEAASTTGCAPPSAATPAPSSAPTPAPSSAPSSAYRADIDGLRAVAVVLVVAYHYGVPGVTGGYLGVDLFFTISGFLIASILARTPSLTLGGLLAFYGRRIKRLMPAFVFVAAITALVSAALLLPEDWQALLRSIRESLVFRANDYFARETTGYFAAATAELPWLHTWSLSVEWQFYLAFPLAALGVRALPTARSRHAAWAALIGCGVAWSAWTVARDPAHAYFSAAARAFEFGLGAWAASVRAPALAPGRPASLLGIVALIVLAATFEASTPFPGLDAFVVCAIGVALLVTGRDGSVLAHPWLAALGRRSYAIYLWHWPVIAWLAYVQLVPSIAWTGAALALVLLLSEATHRWIERPGIALAWSPVKAFALACVLPFACTALGYVFVRNHDGFPQRLGADARHAYANLKRFDERKADHCHDLKDRDIEACAFGDLASPVLGLLIGDSHARHFGPFVAGLAAEAHVKVYQLTDSECLTFEGTGGRTGREPVACVNAGARDFAWIREKRFAFVFIAERWIGYAPDALDGLDGSLAAIVSSGARPVLLAPVAEDGTSPKDCFDRHLKLHRADVEDCAIRDDGFATVPKAAVARRFAALRRRYPSLIVVDPQSVQCRDGRCDTVVDATPIYRDTHHLTAFGSAMLGARYRERRGNPLGEGAGR